ncbi:MAG TPA: CDC27 family protein [Terriglobia bacterium]|nr:CDC27 family protein [Terriglobia bacterium]
MQQSTSSRRFFPGVSLTAITQARWLAPALLALAAFSLYGRALGFDFVSDDGEQVIENPYVRNPHLWTQIFTTSVWSFKGKAVQTNFYRPLQIFCYWLLDRVAGPQPVAFHLFNLVLYVAGSVLVFYIGIRLFGSRLPAFLAALLWIAHPLHVEVAVWISALPDLGFGFFYLLAFLIFLRTEERSHHLARGYGLTALAFAPALFFKESAVSFPLVLVAFWFFKPVAMTTRSWKHRALALGFCGLSIGAAAAIRIAALGHLLGGHGAGGIDLGVLTSALGLLGENAKIFFFPVRLSMFRTFTPTGSLLAPWTLIAVIMVGGAMLIRHRFPLISFLVGWWLIALIPCLDIRQLSIPYVADRFSYVPSVGLCLAISGLAIGTGGLHLFKSRRVPWGMVLLSLVAGAWAVETRRVLPAWQSNQTLTKYSMKLYPDNAALHLVEGWKLAYRSGDLAAADREYREAIKLNRASTHPVKPTTYEALIGLGQDSERSGDNEQASRFFQQAIQLIPNFSEAYQALGSFYFPRRDYSRAASYFEKAVKMNPMDPSTRFYLGTCWLKMGLYQQAAEQLRAARIIDPTLRAAYLEEAEALEDAGDAKSAEQARKLLSRQ